MSRGIYTTINKKNYLENGKRLLDLYYYMDFDDENYDIEILKRSLELNILVDYKNYKLDRFINCNNKSINTQGLHKNDVIKRGLLIFNKIFNRLNIKRMNTVWFIYITNGDVNSVCKNALVALINKNPWLKASGYCIYKNAIYINKSDSKDSKFNKMKNVNIVIKKLMLAEHDIIYTNLVE